MDKRLLDIICCPVTRLPLQLLDTSRLDALNAAIRAGGVKTVDDQPLQDDLQEALVTRDGRLAYPVRDGIPILLEEECINLAQVNT
jgi:uncharacterized protein YbaR (Trm112 family)